MSTAENCKSNMVPLFGGSVSSIHCGPVMRHTNLFLGEGVRQIFAEREACRTTGMFYGVIALGLFAHERIACLGGMAGEW